MPMRKSNTLFVCYQDQFHIVADFPKSSPARISKENFFEQRLSKLNIAHIDRQTCCPAHGYGWVPAFLAREKRRQFRHA